MWQPIHTLPWTGTIPIPCLFLIIRSNLNNVSLSRSGAIRCSPSASSASSFFFSAISFSIIAFRSSSSCSCCLINASSFLISSSRRLWFASFFNISFRSSASFLVASWISRSRASYSRWVVIPSIPFSARSRFCSVSNSSAFNVPIVCRIASSSVFFLT